MIIQKVRCRGIGADGKTIELVDFSSDGLRGRVCKEYLLQISLAGLFPNPEQCPYCVYNPEQSRPRLGLQADILFEEIRNAK